MMSGLLAHRRGWPDRILSYSGRRFIRLYPPFALAVVIFYLSHMITGITAFSSLLVVSMIKGPPPKTLWFVVMLIDFEIAYILVAYLRAYRMRWSVFACGIAGIVYVYVFRSGADNRLLMYALPFAVGVYLSNRIYEKRALVVASAALPISVAILIIAGKDPSNSLTSIPFIIVTSYLLVLSANVLYRANLFDRFIRLLAYAGFAMYLSHRPIYLAMSKLYKPAGTLASYLYFLTIGLLIVVTSSYALQYAYDRVSTSITAAVVERLSRRRERPGQPVLPD